MERIAWRGRIKEGKKSEYIKRHDDIWPEMLELLKSAGIFNYTIFCNGNDLFGYYECEKGIKYAQDKQAQSPVVDRWNEYITTLERLHYRELERFFQAAYDQMR